ncbi:MAG: porin [Verrucomicrobiota bacterium]
MPTNHQLPIAISLALGLQLPASAGTETPAVAPAPSNPGDWCTWLQNKPGMLYKNKENPYLQEFQIEGRLQFQMAHLEGEDVNGSDYSSEFNEFRRFRLGAKAKFLQYFGAKVSFDLVSDDRIAPRPNAGLGWGYEQFDEAFLSFDLGKALGDTAFDTLMVNYGRQKYKFGQEARTSSNELLTVERSAISNKVYGSARPTGLSVDGTIDKWAFTGALYSTTTDGVDNEAFNGWQDAVIYYASAGYQATEELNLRADFVYNDADVATGDNSVLAYEWATSINAEYDAGSWGVIGDLIYGDNGGARTGNTAPEDGEFWGVVVMPYYWLVEEKLQLVGQYQYGGADAAEGIRINSRYGRARGTDGTSGIDVNSGRGDNHNSFYAGLNYYVCGHNAKIQAGIEYQTMDTPIGDFNTLTYLIAFRTFF